jgi:DNA-nicking Smr family endonuclease
MARRFLTEEEQALWDLVNQETKRLKTKKKEVISVKLPREKLPEKKHPKIELPSSFENAFPLKTHSSEIDTLDRRTSRKIRNQTLNIDARLDLHGFIQKDAYARLQSFIKSAHIRGHKLILIITGKGYSSEGAEVKGVLRQKLPQWLKEAETFPQVLSVSSAQPQDGGNGAYYVFLKKPK